MAFKFAPAFAAALALAAPAAAQTVTAANPNSVVEALQSAGYAARLGQDDEGNPKIESASSGSSFIVYFFDCIERQNCRAVQFHSSYEMTAPTAERLVEWNRNQRYARGYLTQSGNTAVEMDVNLDAGGMSRALFVDNLELWTILMSLFEEHVGWER